MQCGMRRRENNMQHVFIIGSKGIPAAYGGFETFVEQLTRHKKKPRHPLPCRVHGKGKRRI